MTVQPGIAGFFLVDAFAVGARLSATCRVSGLYAGKI